MSQFKYVECLCMTPEHTLRFYKDADNFLLIESHLTKLDLRQRVWYALKYVLGKQSNYGSGAFEETILNAEAQDQLRKLLS